MMFKDLFYLIKICFIFSMFTQCIVYVNATAGLLHRLQGSRFYKMTQMANQHNSRIINALLSPSSRVRLDKKVTHQPLFCMHRLNMFQDLFDSIYIPLLTNTETLTFLNKPFRNKLHEAAFHQNVRGVQQSKKDDHFNPTNINENKLTIHNKNNTISSYSSNKIFSVDIKTISDKTNPSVSSKQENITSLSNACIVNDCFSENTTNPNMEQSYTTLTTVPMNRKVPPSEFKLDPIISNKHATSTAHNITYNLLDSFNQNTFSANATESDLTERTTTLSDIPIETCTPALEPDKVDKLNDSESISFEINNDSSTILSLRDTILYGDTFHLVIKNSSEVSGLDFREIHNNNIIDTTEVFSYSTLGPTNISNMNITKHNISVLPDVPLLTMKVTISNITLNSLPSHLFNESLTWNATVLNSTQYSSYTLDTDMLTTSYPSSSNIYYSRYPFGFDLSTTNEGDSTTTTDPTLNTVDVDMLSKYINMSYDPSIEFNSSDDNFPPHSIGMLNYKGNIKNAGEPLSYNLDIDSVTTDFEILQTSENYSINTLGFDLFTKDMGNSITTTDNIREGSGLEVILTENDVSFVTEYPSANSLGLHTFPKNRNISNTTENFKLSNEVFPLRTSSLDNSNKTMTNSTDPYVFTIYNNSFSITDNTYIIHPDLFEQTNQNMAFQFDREYNVTIPILAAISNEFGENSNASNAFQNQNNVSKLTHAMTIDQTDSSASEEYTEFPILNIPDGGLVYVNHLLPVQEQDYFDFQEDL